jgi:hypothetical protein
MTELGTACQYRPRLVLEQHASSASFETRAAIVLAIHPALLLAAE